MFHQHIEELSEQDQIRFGRALAIEQRLYRGEAFAGFAVNCHAIARAFAPYLGCRVRTGVFLEMSKEGETITRTWHSHSWLQLQRGWVMDIKPVGIMSAGPVLVDTKPQNGMGWFAYTPLKPGDEEYPNKARSVETRHMTKELSVRIEEVLKRWPLQGSEIYKFCPQKE